MKFSKKSLIALAIAGALGVGGGVGTYAWFTSGAETSGQIQAGTVILESNGKGTKVVEIDNLAPGEERESVFSFRVDYKGSIEAFLDTEINYGVTIVNNGKPYSMTVKPDLLKVRPKLSGKVEVTEEDWISITDLKAWLNKNFKGKTFSKGNCEKLELDVKLDGELASNIYQGAKFKVGIKVNAKQYNDPKANK